MVVISLLVTNEVNMVIEYLKGTTIVGSILCVCVCGFAKKHTHYTIVNLLALHLISQPCTIWHSYLYMYSELEVSDFKLHIH